MKSPAGCARTCAQHEELKAEKAVADSRGQKFRVYPHHRPGEIQRFQYQQGEWPPVTDGVKMDEERARGAEEVD
jgi:hypothetical protein